MNKGKISIEGSADKLSEFGFEDISRDEYFLEGLKNSHKQMGKREIDELWERIASQNNIPVRRPMYRYWIAAIAGVAACILLVLKISTSTEAPDTTLQEDGLLVFVMNNPKMEEQTSEIRLVLSNENIVSIYEDNPTISYGAEGVTVSDKMLNQTNMASFNQLVVPYGKRSELILSDSSKMWVNAGTRIVYPVVFQNHRREIFVEGEVFLNITADTQKPFFVKTHHVTIQVVGTQFNVRAHSNENETVVAVVSGAVDVVSQNKKHRLEPNDIYVYSEGNETVENTDIDKHISWKDGLFIIQSERLDEIAKRLSRYYGVRIICDPTAAPMKCSGRLVLSENLETVLDGITYAAPVVWSYDEDGSIKIKPK